MKIEIKNNNFYLTDIKAPKIKVKNKIKKISKSYEINIEDLSNGRNIFIFLNENEDVFLDNIDITKAQYIKKDDYVVYVYKTSNNNLVFYKNHTILGNTQIKIKKYSYDKNGIVLKYKINKINKWEYVDKVLIRDRNTKEVIKIDIPKVGNKLNISYELFAKEGIYDFFASINVDTKKSYIVRIGKYRYIKSLFLKSRNYEKNKKITILSPYITYKGSNLSLKIDITPKEYYEELFVRYPKKDVWLIGEQRSKAQDNGYYFFKYVRENHKDIEAFYVIDKHSKDYEKIKGLGNIIDFGSKEHFQIINQTKYLISTHHPDYLFPIQDMRFIKNNKAKKIFLQHGVMGTKYMANFYGNYANNDFNIDLFITSSKREQNMIVEDFKYDIKNVKVTGLARFDSLLEKKDKQEINKNSIEVLIIPTWRDWLSNEFDFEKTEYFINYVALIKKIKDKYRVKLVLHINMGQYVEYFKNLGIDVHVADEVDVQSLLKEARVMITDYSSVSFDFSFLNKPVIYYQFDQERFFGKLGSHFDIYEELPGEIVKDENGVILTLERLKNLKYKVDKQTSEKSNKLIKYKDLNSCQRIYEAIIKEDYKINKKWYKSRFFQKVYSRYRKSKLYYITMKIMYNIMKYFPKKEYALFESNNGKSFVDSPKEIYKEWKSVYPNQKFIIIYNGILPQKYSKNTKCIRRLTPSYFYYLARAKYWISNQNFPYYIKNHNTIYLQTWHGVPIKKMLNDLEVIVGRDDGYKKRVQTAINQWTYVLSTGKYTTDCFKSAFDYKAHTLEVGFPRNDIFFRENKSTIKKIEKKYQLQNKKIILFAPTFRDDGEKVQGKYIQDLYLDYKKLYSSLKENYIFLLKLHPLAKAKEEVPKEYTTFFKEVDPADDINDIMLVSDFLITDYSSVMFDYLLHRGKTILYAKDIKEYEFKNRGFYMDYKKEAPGVIVQNMDELICEIKKEEISYDKQMYKDKYMSQNEEVSKKIIDLIKG